MQLEACFVGSEPARNSCKLHAGRHRVGTRRSHRAVPCPKYWYFQPSVMPSRGRRIKRVTCADKFLRIAQAVAIDVGRAVGDDERIMAALLVSGL